MGVAKGALWPAVQRRFPADRLDCRHFQRFVLVQRWQQPGQAAGEQGFAGAGRPGEQQVVTISTKLIVAPYQPCRHALWVSSSFWPSSNMYS
ncbi:hypothetical protein D3C76_674140 [compost metagenome]